MLRKGFKEMSVKVEPEPCTESRKEFSFFVSKFETWTVIFSAKVILHFLFKDRSSQTNVGRCG